MIGSLCASATDNINLVVLPEYAYSFSPEFVLKCPHGPQQLAQKFHCPVVFGAIREIPHSSNYYNVAAVIDDKGKLLDAFPKQRPVPLFQDGLPGTRRPVIPTTDGILGVAVCYDFDAQGIAATLVGQGATVLVAPTCDALSWGRVQHRPS